METTIDAAYFRRLFLPTPLVFIAALIFTTPLLFPMDARADDDVLVLPTGPTRHAQILGLTEANSQPVSVDLGQYQLLNAAIGAAPIRDLKILPGGQSLLSDVDGRGVLIADSLGQAEFSLDAPGARLRITSASVSAYAAPGEVARLLITDSNRSQAFVIDPRDPDERISWVRGFSLPGARADFVDAIALPGQRSAIAINWTTLGVSAIDIYKTQSGNPQSEIRRLAGAVHPNQPEDMEIIPEIEHLRAIMGLANGNLLVTTQYALFEMDLEGKIKWKITLGQDAVDLNGDALNLRGEFSDSTILPSGRIAVSTLQPGVWTSPHINHRVYWLSPSALENSEIEVIARSEALGFAPFRIEARDGHGASGSFGFRPGLGSENSGPLGDLKLSSELRLDQADYVDREIIRASADVQNTGASTVSLSSVIVLANSGACGAQTETSIPLVEVVAVEIPAGETFSVRSHRAVDAAFTPGRWCARMHAQNGLGERVELGTAVGFDIREPAGDSGSTVDIEDLDFWPGSPDGDDPDTDPPPADFPTLDDAAGCGCASSQGAAKPNSLPAGAFAFLMVGALGWMRRRMASRRS